MKIIFHPYFSIFLNFQDLFDDDDKCNKYEFQFTIDLFCASIGENRRSKLSAITTAVSFVTSPSDFA